MQLRYHIPYTVYVDGNIFRAIAIGLQTEPSSLIEVKPKMRGEDYDKTKAKAYGWECKCDQRWLRQYFFGVKASRITCLQNYKP